jgi:hypothetical protein
MPCKTSSGKPWRAYQKRSGKVYYLGTYETREEAVVAEQEFAKVYPPGSKAWPEHARKKSAEKRRKGEQIQRWKAPEPMPQGESREARQERARRRAMRSLA